MSRIGGTAFMNSNTVAVSPEAMRRARTLLAVFGGKQTITNDDVSRFIDRLLAECVYSTNDPTTMLHQAIRQAAR